MYEKGGGGGGGGGDDKEEDIKNTVNSTPYVTLYWCGLKTLFPCGCCSYPIHTHTLFLVNTIVEICISEACTFQNAGCGPFSKIKSQKMKLLESDWIYYSSRQNNQ